MAAVTIHSDFRDKKWNLSLVPPLHPLFAMNYWGWGHALSSVQFRLVTQLSPTFCNLMDCSIPDLPAHHQVLEPAKTHVHDESVMPSNHLILCRPLLLLISISPCIRVFSNESVLHIRWPKYWNFNFSISRSNEYSGVISFRMDWFDLLAVQETLRSLLQHHSSKASILRCSALFIVQLPYPYMTTGKIIGLTRWAFVGKVMFLLYNMLPRLVIAFLPMSKHLLISRLQSPSEVILDPEKVKVSHCFHCFLIYLPWNDGSRCHDLHFLNVEFLASFFTLLFYFY